MAGKKVPIRIRFRRSSLLMKVVLLAAVVLSTVAVVALNASIDRAQQDYEAMRQQAAALVAENNRLSERIASLGSVESAIQIAMEQLGLVEPDTVVVTPGN